VVPVPEDVVVPVEERAAKAVERAVVAADNRQPGSFDFIATN
jgi:hypothetical protein